MMIMRRIIVAFVLSMIILTAACGSDDCPEPRMSHTNDPPHMPADGQSETTEFPEFNCQEDELMVWVDARNTAECVNEEEYAEELHRDAGHVP